jgi:hypothetical protein
LDIGIGAIGGKAFQRVFDTRFDRVSILQVSDKSFS